MNASKRLFVTDFDGTLAQPDGSVAETDIEMLKDLGSMGIVRVIATGRSLFSFSRTVTNHLPLDFLIFSTGGGITVYPEKKLLKKSELSRNMTVKAAKVLMEARLDFMIHQPVPENHCFYWHRATTGNPDFENRLTLYKDYSSPLDPSLQFIGPSAQLLAVLPKGFKNPPFDLLRKKLNGYSIVRTTSPLDKESIWIEIFPAKVSKAGAAEWLANTVGISTENVCAVGNDYNDLDLLEWAGAAFVVHNSPEELYSRFATAPFSEKHPVAWAAKQWI